MPTPTKKSVTLSPAAERKKKIKVKEAADIAGVSENTFRRHYPHLIKQITPRCQAVELGDVLDL
jgi:hypothetical protein